MPLYSYKAMDLNGRVVSGNLDARDEEELDRRLLQMDLELTRSREVRPNRFFGRGRITRKDLINFSVHMEQLMRAGISVMEGLEDIRNSTESPMFRGVVAALLADIEGGKSLSQALDNHPEAFDKVMVSLVRAGEESGRLDEVFHNIANALKWQDEIVSQTIRAILYPAFVLTVVMGVVTFMMIYLVPRLVGFLTGLGHDIPLHTRMLIATSNAFVDYWYLIIGIPVGLAILYRTFNRISPLFRIFADRQKLRLPVVGPILEKIALARLASYFALTYRAGVGVIDCIRLCGGREHQRRLREDQAVSRAGDPHVARGREYGSPGRIAEQRGLFLRAGRARVHRPHADSHRAVAHRGAGVDPGLGDAGGARPHLRQHLQVDGVARWPEA